MTVDRAQELGEQFCKEHFPGHQALICTHREGLYQIDLLNGSKERITEREYWAAKKGQLALDKENAAREAAGQPTKPTKFETDKAYHSPEAGGRF